MTVARTTIILIELNGCDSMCLEVKHSYTRPKEGRRIRYKLVLKKDGKYYNSWSVFNVGVRRGDTEYKIGEKTIARLNGTEYYGDAGLHVLPDKKTALEYLKWRSGLGAGLPEIDYPKYVLLKGYANKFIVGGIDERSGIPSETWEEFTPIEEVVV